MQITVEIIKNVRYDELVKTAKSTADPKVRVPAMIEMEKNHF